MEIIELFRFAIQILLLAHQNTTKSWPRKIGIENSCRKNLWHVRILEPVTSLMTCILYNHAWKENLYCRNFVNQLFWIRLPQIRYKIPYKDHFSYFVEFSFSSKRSRMRIAFEISLILVEQIERRVDTSRPHHSIHTGSMQGSSRFVRS